MSYILLVWGVWIMNIRYVLMLVVISCADSSLVSKEGSGLSVCVRLSVAEGKDACSPVVG